MAKKVNKKAGTSMGGTMIHASTNRVKCDCNNCCNWDTRKRYCRYYDSIKMKKSCARYDPINEAIVKIPTAEFVFVTNKDESYRGLKYKNKVYLEDNKTIKTFKGGKVQAAKNPEWATRELIAMQKYLNTNT